ncbi:DUF4041 domain-containing protein [Aliiroseovarius sp. PrR006]|uniref:DUF4041 domain-containing protein n=1 Tax=Aliiroseovarius sp. PrR006 TaxID=2706883 RepID=UPI0013D7D6F4|nr:DUF4041 domain-containing protein [Aliiroseovarius sp. PrR006]NDW52922.1 DUF4041 domain-containing protein [Aliiroseovarius sp. PrR006]
MDISISFALFWMLLPLPLLFLWLRNRSLLRNLQSTHETVVEEHEALKNRFSDVLSVEDEVTRLTAATDTARQDLENLRSDYREKRTIFDKLTHQIAIYDERIALAELGIYEPHFDYGDSEAFKSAIKEKRAKQKEMVSKKTATLCPNSWTLDGSRSKGETMVNRQSRLTLRAFNNECEAAIANTRWNNVVAMEKRIQSAAKQIDSANNSMQLTLNPQFIALKIDELRLTHEYREKLKVEKEERAEATRQQREEKKLLAEAAAAEKKEAEYQKLLNKARAEAGVDQSRIDELQAQLDAAHEASARARAMAEMTKSGYVYVISNIGSFGEDVVKIGLTRRLDPNDRVKELGDASVPFGFDTHAMIYSGTAPELEKALHNEFSDRRINMSNMRKEFFKVGLDDVKDAVSRLAPNAEFFEDREAQEWHETVARRNNMLAHKTEAAATFPDAI